MRNDNDGGFLLLQETFKPDDRVNVQMVGSARPAEANQAGRMSARPARFGFSSQPENSGDLAVESLALKPRP